MWQCLIVASSSVHLKIVPKIYKTYLDDCGYANNQLSIDNFLQIHGLK